MTERAIFPVFVQIFSLFLLASQLQVAVGSLDENQWLRLGERDRSIIKSSKSLSTWHALRTKEVKKQSKWSRTLQNLEHVISLEETPKDSPVDAPTCPELGEAISPPFDEGNCYPVTSNNIVAPMCATNFETGCKAKSDGMKKTEWSAETAAAAIEAQKYWEAKGYQKHKIVDHIGHVEVLYSFGAMDNATDSGRSGFARIMALSQEMLVKEVVSAPGEAEVTLQKVRKVFGTGPTNMGSRYYVDAKALQRLPGAFWKPGLPLPGPFTLNIWWKEYYQAAMKEAEVMVFLLSAGWFDSKWCGQELDWAVKRRVGKINLVIFLDAVAKAKFELRDEASSKSKANIAKWRALLTSEGLGKDVIDLSESGVSSVATIARVIRVHMANQAQLRKTGEGAAEGTAVTVQLAKASAARNLLETDLDSLGHAVVNHSSEKISSEKKMVAKNTARLVAHVKELKNAIRAHVKKSDGIHRQ